MNQKDYKEIAGINKSLIQLLLAEGYQNWDRLPSKAIKKHMIEQADYFEREDNSKFETKSSGSGVKYVSNFNKQQFLKDCGIK